MHPTSIFFTPDLSNFKLIIVVLALSLSACTTIKSTSTSPPVEIPDSTELQDCPKMNVSNSPDLVSLDHSSLACVNGVKLLVAPAPNACLSSGFGNRNKNKPNKIHKGIDYQSKPAGPVVAASAGTVVRVKNRKKDYGNWIVIDHGAGIYTSYAHLANVNAKVVEGAKVALGQTLGIMGSTGGASKAIHLHYELRQGNIKKRKGYFGLKPIDPYALPQNCI